MQYIKDRFQKHGLELTVQCAQTNIDNNKEKSSLDFREFEVTQL